MFLVSKQNLNPSYLCIWHIKDHKKHIRIEKVIASKVEEVKNSKKQTHEHYKVGFDHQKNSLYMALLLLKFKDDL